MARHRRVLDRSALPPLHFDWTKSASELLDDAAEQLNKNGVLSNLMVGAECTAGRATIPLVCGVGNEYWAPYIEGQEWSDDVVTRFVEWLTLVRQSQQGSVKIQFYSRTPVPDIVLALAKDSPMARLQLEAHANCEENSFSTNAFLLRRLVDTHLKVDLAMTPDSLPELDNLIMHHLGDSAPLVVTQAFVHLVGCFLGEVLIATRGGHWTAPQNGQTLWTLSPEGVAPLAIAIERFKHGSAAPLSALASDREQGR